MTASPDDYDEFAQAFSDAGADRHHARDAPRRHPRRRPLRRRVRRVGAARGRGRGEEHAGGDRLVRRPGVRRTGLRQRGRRRAAAAVLRRAGPTAGDGRRVRGQRGLDPGDGEDRDDHRGPWPPGLAASRPGLGRRDRRGRPGRRVASGVRCDPRPDLLAPPDRPPRVPARDPDDLEALGRIQNLPEVAYWLPSAAGTQADYLAPDGRRGAAAPHARGGAGRRRHRRAVPARGRGLGAGRGRRPGRGHRGGDRLGADPAHQGHGYATEAATELVRICFEELGVRRVTATAFADNHPSLRIMERLGMRCETRGVRTTLHRERGWVDSTVYALLADEWRGADQGAHR